jgi:hypothetical protein
MHNDTSSTVVAMHTVSTTTMAYQACPSVGADVTIYHQRLRAITNVNAASQVAQHLVTPHLGLHCRTSDLHSKPVAAADRVLRPALLSASSAEQDANATPMATYGVSFDVDVGLCATALYAMTVCFDSIPPQHSRRPGG